MVAGYVDDPFALCVFGFGISTAFKRQTGIIRTSLSEFTLCPQCCRSSSYLALHLYAIATKVGFKPSLPNAVLQHLSKVENPACCNGQFPPSADRPGGAGGGSE
jgi:hypothetical protein